MTRDNAKSWREICKEALRERDTDRVNALLEELSRALEERSRKRNKSGGAKKA